MGPNASVASWFSVLRNKISGICLELALATGLVLDPVCYRGIDTPALQVIVRNSSLSVVPWRLTYFPKKAKLRGRFSVEVFRRNVECGASKVLGRTYCRNDK
jgi:hypothetical protein